MILNISGRTDIVNYYSEWMFKRFEAGYVLSRNSLFPNQVRRYELDPTKVDCLIFGSKNYTPVLSRISEITALFNTYFYYTITAYGTDIGAMNSCPNGCKYCYANKNHASACETHRRHDPNSPLLIGYLKPSDNLQQGIQKTFLDQDKTHQVHLDL